MSKFTQKATNNGCMVSWIWEFFNILDQSRPPFRLYAIESLGQICQSQIVVNSGCILPCFWAILNIWDPSSSPIWDPPPPSPRGQRRSAVSYDLWSQPKGIPFVFRSNMIKKGLKRRKSQIGIFCTKPPKRRKVRNEPFLIIFDQIVGFGQAPNMS